MSALLLLLLFRFVISQLTVRFFFVQILCFFSYSIVIHFIEQRVRLIFLLIYLFEKQAYSSFMYVYHFHRTVSSICRIKTKKIFLDCCPFVFRFQTPSSVLFESMNCSSFLFVFVTVSTFLFLFSKCAYSFSFFSFVYVCNNSFFFLFVNNKTKQKTRSFIYIYISIFD